MERRGVDLHRGAIPSCFARGIQTKNATPRSMMVLVLMVLVHRRNPSDHPRVCVDHAGVARSKASYTPV